MQRSYALALLCSRHERYITDPFFYKILTQFSNIITEFTLALNQQHL